MTEFPANNTDLETRTELGWKGQLLELLVFLFLIVPSMIFSFVAVKQGALGFGLTACATIMRDLALVGLIFFFLWRNREPMHQIGWTTKGWRKEIGLGLALFIPMFFAIPALERALQQAGFTAPSTPLPSFLAAKDVGQLVLAFILVVVVAAAEETIFRGYLILRFRFVARSSRAAALLSAVLFSLGHGYEGTAGVVTIGFMGHYFAVIYLWRRSLVAPVVMHFLQDFMGIILVPLLGMK
jgi:membrane protease YdiL (CAAX protease family)